MNFDLLTKVISANPEKMLDIIGRAIDLLKASPLLQTALAKWIESRAK